MDDGLNKNSRELHVERHFTATELVRDIVIGMSDGLTVPFALAAGLSGAIHESSLIVTAGLAEIAAGSIAMGLGGYLAARNDLEHYAAERRREQREVIEVPERERAEIVELLSSYNLTPEESAPVVAALSRDPELWVDFMMRFELGLEVPQTNRARSSALTIAGSYLVGGFIPLFPYMLMPTPERALTVSVSVTLLALAVFGYVKGRLIGSAPWKGAVQTTLIGAAAAAAAFGIARLVSPSAG